jgi:hypothetical protein
MTNETIESRVERAQSQEMDVTLVDTEPVIVQVYNEESDRIHTVIPDAVHCSCEDHTYRDIICKHLIVLLQDDGNIGEQTREAVRLERNEIDREITEMQNQITDRKAQRDAINEALSAVGAELIADDTVGDIIDGLEAEAEARSEAEDEPSAFERMVEDLQSSASQQSGDVGEVEDLQSEEVEQ